jgi:hypothetical protein
MMNVVHDRVILYSGTVCGMSCFNSSTYMCSNSTVSSGLQQQQQQAKSALINSSKLPDHLILRLVIDKLTWQFPTCILSHDTDAGLQACS